MQRLWVASSSLLLVTAAFAAVDVQTTAEFPSAVGKLAIAPLPCSEDVNCVKIEKHLNKSAALPWVGF